jgi:hypothetical protein
MVIMANNTTKTDPHCTISNSFHAKARPFTPFKHEIILPEVTVFYAFVKSVTFFWKFMQEGTAVFSV